MNLNVASSPDFRCHLGAHEPAFPQLAWRSFAPTQSPSAFQQACFTGSHRLPLASVLRFQVASGVQYRVEATFETSKFGQLSQYLR